MNLRSFLRNLPEDDARTNAGLAAAYNADPSNWSLIYPESVWAWLAKGARRMTLRGFVDSDAGGDPQTLGLQNAVGVLLDGIQSSRVTLDATPGSDQRALVDAVESLGLTGIGPADIAELLAYARPEGWTDATEADVTDAKARIVREDTAGDADAVNSEALSKARQINDLARRDGSVSPVTLVVPEAPEGWVFGDDGTLVGE